MSNPTGNFSSDLDPYDRLAQMFDGGLFKLLPLPPSWANYVRAQYAPDPSLFSAPTSDTPGFDKSPAVLEPIAAADPRPAGFNRSPMFTGVGTTTPGFRPLPPTPIGDTPGFHKSPAVLEALANADPRPPGFYRSPALLGASETAPSLDSNLTAAVSPQGTRFGWSGLSPMSVPSLPLSWSGVTPVSFPSPPSPPATVDSPPADQPSPVTPVNSPPTDVPNITPAPATVPEPPSTMGRSGVAPPVEPPSNNHELEQEFQKWPGQIVRRPDGLPVLDPTSPTGYLMSPFSDLSDVAAR